MTDRTGINPRINVDGPFLKRRPGNSPLPTSFSLEEYMASEAMQLRIPSGEMASFSKADLVLTIADKFGGAHEDWGLPENVRTLISLPYRVQGLPISVLDMAKTADWVLLFGRTFLEEYGRRNPPVSPTELT